MTRYRYIYEFVDDTKRLIERGTSLRGLYDALLTVKEASPIDASAKELRELAQRWTQWPTFIPIRLHELFAGLQVEHSDDYVLAMVGGLGGRRDQDVRLFMLRHDHQLREEVFWRVFEVEGGGEVSLANIDKFSREELNWHNTVLLLVSEGTLDRTRVLRCCLEALNRDFSAYRAGWFSRVYAALAPTPEEAAADQELLRLCLGSSVTATVSLGVKQLAGVHQVGLLEPAAFVEACGPALAGPKAAALTVVRILTALGGDVEPGLVAESLALGLGHPHADVQRASVKALAALGRADLAVEQREALAPAVAAELLPTQAVAELSTPTPAYLPTGPAEAEPVQPWSEADAVERFAALQEEPSDALEVELALAWLAAAERPSETLAPLLKRAAKIESHRPSYWISQLLVVAADPSVEYLPQTFWRRTVTFTRDGALVMEEGEPEPHPTEEETSVLPSFVTRLREVASILRGRAPRRPLLATPTDTHGWIDPAVFRNRHLAHGKVAPLPVDLAQALLRLHPDGREAVLTEFGLTLPPLTDEVRIEWRSRGSNTLKANGEPEWVWWDPVIHAAKLKKASPEQPGLIPSTPKKLWRSYSGTTELVTGELALVHPASTLHLAAVGVGVLNNALSEVEHQAGPVLATLAGHPGAWTPETIQVVALGMAAQPTPLRAQAAELLAAAVPARISVSAAAEGFAACAPAIVLTRWAGSFTDAAGLAPAAVVDLLAALLPRLDRTTRGIGSLLTVLLDESLRLGRRAEAPVLRDWLAGFTGSSAAAKTAKALLA
ncbi:MAG: DUF6493 family protein [Propionicimonas sp.]